jgi:predicted HAD superfamily Cof-like phosphohydrolase
MRPTHRHPDGGVYEYVESCSHKDDSTGEWVKGVAYRGEDGKLRSTSEARWKDRFEPLTLEVTNERCIELMDDEDNMVASFVFRVEEAGDIRHMLITAGPGAGKRLGTQEQSWIKRVLLAQADMITQGLHIREHDFPDLIGDVAAFHAKFGQEYTGKPRQLPADLHEFRVKFHDEETHEYRDEYPKLCDAITRQDRRDIMNTLELQLDALCDAAWVILGTADLQFGRKAFYEAWRRVVKANMAKVLATDDPNAQDSGREVKYDIRKPAGWEAPDHRDLVADNAIFDEIFGLPSPDVETNTFNQDAASYSDTRAV